MTIILVSFSYIISQFAADEGSWAETFYMSMALYYVYCSGQLMWLNNKSIAMSLYSSIYIPIACHNLYLEYWQWIKFGGLVIEAWIAKLYVSPLQARFDPQPN